MSCFVAWSVACPNVVAIFISLQETQRITGSSRHTRYGLPQVRPPPAAVHLGTPRDTAEEDVTHFPCQTARVAVQARVVPRIDPVHHSEQRQNRRAAVKLEVLFSFVVFEQIATDAVVLPLELGHLPAVARGEHVVLVGEHLHRVLMLQEILEVIGDKSANALFRIVALRYPPPEPYENIAETELLDEV